MRFGFLPCGGYRWCRFSAIIIRSVTRLGTRGPRFLVSQSEKPGVERSPVCGGPDAQREWNEDVSIVAGANGAMEAYKGKRGGARISHERKKLGSLMERPIWNVNLGNLRVRKRKTPEAMIL